MSLVIPPGFGSAAFVFTGAVGTQPYVTTMGLDLGDAGGDFVGAANRAFDAWEEVLIAETSNALTLDRVTLAVGSDGPGGSVDSSRTPIPGEDSGTYGPTAMSAIGRKVTAELGRAGRGRMFLPGFLAENAVDPDGSVVAARRDAITIALDTFVANLQLGGTVPGMLLPPVLLHSAGGPAPTPIETMVCSDLVGWIRGRIR